MKSLYKSIVFGILPYAILMPLANERGKVMLIDVAPHQADLIVQALADQISLLKSRNIANANTYQIDKLSHIKSVIVETIKEAI